MHNRGVVDIKTEKLSDSVSGLVISKLNEFLLAFCFVCERGAAAQT